MKLPAAVSLLHPRTSFWVLMEEGGGVVKLRKKWCLLGFFPQRTCSCVHIKVKFCADVFVCRLRCRGVLILAAALWQYVLPPCGSAQLHDPADDERMVKSQGKLAGVCARTTDVMHSSRVFISCWLCFGLTFAPTSPTMRFLLAISCWLVSLFLLCYFFFFVSLAAVWRWPSELVQSLRCSQRNKPVLLPSPRGCGDKHWACLHYRN